MTNNSSDMNEEITKLLWRHTWLNIKLIFARRETYKWFKLVEEIEGVEKQLNYPNL